MAKKTEILTYTNERGGSIEFSRNSVFRVNIPKQVTGIADVFNDIYSISSMGQDGDTDVGSRIEPREIEILGSINERKRDRILEYRRLMNRVLNPQYAGTLTYDYGDFRRVIDCKVDTATKIPHDAIFQDFTLLLKCSNPFWRKEGKTRNDIATWMGAFEFPVEIPFLEGWEIGYREPSLIVDVLNEGDVKTGIRVEFRALGEVLNPIILNVDRQDEFILINMKMLAGDVLVVNTGYGEKEVTLTRNGVTTDAYRYLDPDSTYMQLVAGDNLFRYNASSNLENLEVSIYHDDLYLGV